ncbi:MAG: hypothetical protein QXL17_06570 [Candidatus Thermoplasmatota archaeon]
MVLVLQRKDQTSIVCRPAINKRSVFMNKGKTLQMMIAVGAIITGILLIIH